MFDYFKIAVINMANWQNLFLAIDLICHENAVTLKFILANLKNIFYICAILRIKSVKILIADWLFAFLLQILEFIRRHVSLLLSSVVILVFMSSHFLFS
jgi:hypothetical protein